MNSNIKYRISVTLAGIIIVAALSGIVYFKIVSNEIVHTAGYYVFTEVAAQNTAVQEHSVTKTKESNTESDSASSDKHGTNGSGSYHNSFSQKGSSGKNSVDNNTAKPVAAEKTTVITTTVVPETTTQPPKRFDSVFVYSADTKKIHSRSCPYVNNINEENYYYINSESADELFEQGYEFCSYCRGYVIN
ncbi:MAG: hypothetical protein IJL63_01600 [Clostridia bacterium]|nr:hypothetical protein [Clostridia bacterium]